MTHLRIEQSDSATEEVSSAVIKKLYDLAISGELDNTSDLLGRLHTTITYKEYIDALCKSLLNPSGMFPNLYISSDNYYIMFLDPEVLSVLLANNIGDGTGITIALAAAVTNLNIGTIFKNNTTVLSFNELNNFTNIHQLNEEAFYGCSNLENITLPLSCTTLGAGTFRGCTKLKQMDLTNVTTINTRTFWSSCEVNGTDPFVINMPNLTSLLGNGNFGFSGVTSVQSLGNSITHLPSSCFDSCKRLTLVNLPSTVTSMDDAFLDCDHLTTINLDNVLIIGTQAFFRCYLLSNIGSLSSCIRIRSLAFLLCNNLSLSIDDLLSVVTFNGGRDAGPFGYGGSTPSVLLTGTDLYLPNVRTIGDSVFSNQTNITTINLPNLTELDGNKTFMNCTSLLEVVSLGSVTTISGDFSYGGNGTFENCINLTTVNLPQNLTNFTRLMFNGCSSLTTINIPTTITRFDRSIFTGCSSLADKVFYYPNVVGYSEYINAVAPNGDLYIPRITSWAPCWNGIWIGPQNTQFTYRDSSYSIKLMYLKDVTSIGAATFYKLTINTLIINNTTVPTINPTAESYIISQIPTINTDIFYGITSINSIYVPDSAVSDYLNSSLFASQSAKIKPLSLCPRVTLQLAESGSIGLIEAYM